MLKYLETAHKTMNTVKTDQQSMVSTVEEISKQHATNTTTVPAHFSYQEDTLNALKEALEDLKSKFDAQQSEILCLKNDLAKIGSHVNKDISLLNPSAPPLPTLQQSSAPLENITASEGKICTGPKNAKLKIANPNIGERLAKLSWIYMENLDVNTESSAITELLNPEFKNIYVCEKLPSKYSKPKSATFKLGVPEHLEKEYLAPNFWPDGIYVDRYRSKTQGTSHLPGPDKGRDSQSRRTPRLRPANQGNFRQNQQPRYRQ